MAVMAGRYKSVDTGMRARSPVMVAKVRVSRPLKPDFCGLNLQWASREE